jgi:hypothetical protein
MCWYSSSGTLNLFRDAAQTFEIHPPDHFARGGPTFGYLDANSGLLELYSGPIGGATLCRQSKTLDAAF